MVVQLSDSQFSSRHQQPNSNLSTLFFMMGALHLYGVTRQYSLGKLVSNASSWLNRCVEASLLLITTVVVLEHFIFRA